ncbi:uncharacterized protein LOC132165950 [Corylus avellana]|uniref:uncharacterized protein LOC132165950 n=1 Tax=Corylus avellana TaxID=13451 RepID=UPI00286A71F6|nr:uncharacterized protein LOC132165950 [Corylus avellana]
MARRRAKKTVKKLPSSPVNDVNGAVETEAQIDKEQAAFTDQEVERQSAAIRAIRDVEIEHLLTEVRLLRSYFSEEQLQTSAQNFFKENLPNLLVVRNEGNRQFEMQWNNEDGNLPMNQGDGSDIHTSLLRRLSMAYPDCSAAIASLGGFQFSSKAVKTSLVGAANLQISDFVLEEPSDSQMLGMQDGLRTPGVCLFLVTWVYIALHKVSLLLKRNLCNTLEPNSFQLQDLEEAFQLMQHKMPANNYHCTIDTPMKVSSQRLSVGMTLKTLRLPKPGEMLLSVHGSPLGVYKEDNMEAINESEEG